MLSRKGVTLETLLILITSAIAVALFIYFIVRLVSA
jgi:hypothetical protein